MLDLTSLPLLRICGTEGGAPLAPRPVVSVATGADLLDELQVVEVVSALDWAMNIEYSAVFEEATAADEESDLVFLVLEHPDDVLPQVDWDVLKRGCRRYRAPADLRHI